MPEEQSHTSIDPELFAELAAAELAAKGAELSPDEEAKHATIERIEEAKEQRRAAERKRRAIEGAALVRKAKAEAGGRYGVRYYDLGSLLPDAPADKLPGKGILVIRSHPPAAKTAFDSGVEDKGKTLAAAFADLVCESVVYPPIKSVETLGLGFRAFLESELGNGTPAQIGAAVLELGGARATEAKRATR